jgi:hypothetical protein
MQDLEIPMAKNRDVGGLLDRVDILERKVGILEEKLEENKRFTFEEIRRILLRMMSLEDSVSKLESRTHDPR